MSFVLLAGCASSAPLDPVGEAIPTVTWALQSFEDGTPPADGVVLTMQISEGRVSGNAGCNRYFGTVDASRHEIAIAQIGMTRMACPAPMMSYERRFTEALSQVTSWSLYEQMLILSDSEGRQILTFEPEQVYYEAARLKGTVTYRPRIALPPNAEVMVRLEDVSLADAPANALSEVSFVTGGKQVPLAFDLNYNTLSIDPGHHYAVRAEIRDRNGDLLWISGTRHPVLTNGAPSDNVEVVVVQVELLGIDRSSERLALVGPVWVLDRLELLDGTLASIQNPSSLTVAFGDDGRYGGRADCNSHSGEYRIGTDESLVLGHSATTLAACAPGSFGTQYLSALQTVRSYQLQSRGLLLRLADGRALAFRPIDQPTELAGQGPVSSDSLRIDDETMQFHVRVGLPDDSTLPPYAVSEVRNTMRVFAESFRPTEQPDPTLEAWRTTTTVEGGTVVGLARPDLFSALVEVYAFSGGAHGLTVFKSINLNPQTGEWLELNDLFVDGGPLRRLLAREATDAVLTTMVEQGGLAPGDANNELLDYTDGGIRFDNAPLFTLDEDALIIHISPYEVAPYVYGTFAVRVPFESLRPFIRADGLLGAMR